MLLEEPDRKITSMQVDQDVKCGEGKVVYDLLGTIAHVLDPKCGGNLVGHIHVGKCYHSRKEVSNSTEEGGVGGVAHALDPNCGGNLMALIHVGKCYRSRKEMSSGTEGGGGI